MSITLTGKQIQMLAEYAGFVIESDSNLEEDEYTIERDVIVDGVKEPVYVYCTEYPEEGGTTLKELE